MKKAVIYIRVSNILLAIGIIGLIYGVIGFIRVLISPDFELVRRAFV
jgi:hypothetical protein